MPWPVHPTGFLGARGDQDTYRIERSLRFNSADSAYLNRTLVSPTNNIKWTLSWWMKKTTNGLSSGGGTGDCGIISTSNSVNTDSIGFYNGDDQLRVLINSSTVAAWSPVIRDVSAWYHFVVVYDSANSTQSDRLVLYQNGARVTSLSSAVSLTSSQSIKINSAQTHYIGSATATPSRFFNGYLTEINFIDGQALTPSSFGETDAITGRWKAKAYSGTYGTNGFYLKFADNSGTTSTTLGKDSSPNGNNWTPNNFSVTAGVGNDSLVDSPTNYGTDTGLGGEVRGNYCTWNPLVPGDSATNGNLDVINDTARGNQELMKYNSYWEVTSTGGTCLAGIISTTATSTVTVGSAKTFGFKLSTAGVFEYANVTDGSSFTSQATATTPPLAYASTGSGITASINAGQRPFVATAPSGFKALCTTNLPQPTIQKPSKYMDVVAYTGTGASNSITGLDFSPDLVWIKNRGTTTSHALYDTTRGTQLQLSSNLADSEITSSTGLTAFGSSGFTVGTSSLVNTSGTQYVAWAWDEAPIAGMDIVSYAGNGTTQNVSHSLGVTPKMVIVKNRDTNARSWNVYHSGLTAGNLLSLNQTSAQFANTNRITAVSSSNFTIGSDSDVNENTKNHIAYLFAEVEGFSKFGSYTGNGSADGPFVWCGFRPRWVMVKRADVVNSWVIMDSSRNTYNYSDSILWSDLSNAETSGGTTTSIDIVSSGFKTRGSGSSINTSGGTYIFSAFAESPFKYARAR